MRRQPRNACAVDWVPLSIPIFANQRWGVRDQFLHYHAGVAGDLFGGSRHEAGRVEGLSADDGQARAAALDPLVDSSREGSVRDSCGPCPCQSSLATKSLSAFVVDRLCEVAQAVRVADYVATCPEPRWTGVATDDAVAAVREVREAL